MNIPTISPDKQISAPKSLGFCEAKNNFGRDIQGVQFDWSGENSRVLGVRMFIKAEGTALFACLGEAHEVQRKTTAKGIMTVATEREVDGGERPVPFGHQERTVLPMVDPFVNVHP